MHKSFFILSLAGVAYSLPTFTTEKRSLIDLSPDVDPTIGLDNAHSCLGIGISVCDPINVGGVQNSNNGDSSYPQSNPRSYPVSKPQSYPESTPVSTAVPYPESTPVSTAVSYPESTPVSYPESTPVSYPESGEKAEESVKDKDSNGGGLLNLSPDISPDINLNNADSCLGLGISVCDPINVGGTQNSNNGGSDFSKGKAPSKPSNSGSGDLINLSPTISPALGLDNSNSCLGIGISACDPINVDGTQNSNDH
ncbi:hypothetical protein F5B20DRAFT_257572 [Whalleya microplaca]|nr:hypothetical protein F5B20DRAFT_257572 [Whalleya microplaca]